MRRSVTLQFLCLAIVMAVLGGCKKSTQPVLDASTQQSTVSLGGIAPLTGEGAEYGKWAQRGVEIALQELNKPDAQFHYRILWEDSRLSPTVAVSCFLKLADADRVPLVIGPLTSGEAIACTAKANEKKVVLLSPTASTDKLTNAGEFFFRVCPSNILQAETAARFCTDKLKAKTAYVFYEDIAYGADLAVAFVERFQAVGGRIVGRDSFREGETDYRPAIQKIRVATPDVVYVPSNYTEAGTLLRQMAQLSVKAKVAGGDGSYGEGLLKLAGEAAEGTYWTNIAWGTGEAKAKAAYFRDAYQRAYGESPHAFAGLYYDAAHVAFGAITRPGMTGLEVRQALLCLPPFQGATGTTKFTDKGQVDKTFAVYVVTNRSFQQIDD